RDLAAVLHKPLPDEVTSRPKSGFVTPVQQWLLGDSSGAESERGLRGWAKHVLPPQPRMFRALVLCTDAFGGDGGIAKFNRDLLRSVAVVPECAGVVALPRVMSAASSEAIPPRVRFVARVAGSKLRFVWAALAQGLTGRVDLL